MHVVVVGAGIAGVTCVEALRAAGHTGRVTLLGAEPHAPYARPPLSKQVLAGTWDVERATIRTAAELRDLDVTLRSGARAESLDPAAHVVLVDGEPMSYDLLVVAAGVEPLRLTVPGGERAVSLRTVDDARILRTAWTRAHHVTVVGTGVLASEIASAARHEGRDVTVVGRSGVLSLGTVGGLLSARLHDLHRAAGVDLRASAGVTAVTNDGIELGDGAVLTTDLVVAAVGGRPRTDWLVGSGLDVSDGVLTDEIGRAAPDVYAIGDVARWWDPRTGRAVRVEHQSGAISQGLAVAATITGGTSSPVAEPFFWSEVHGVRVQAAGAFDPDRPLVPSSEDPDLLTQHDRDGLVAAVGWGAPRAFRQARVTMAERVALDLRATSSERVATARRTGVAA